MAVHVMFFGQLVELAGVSSLELETVADTAALQQLLHTRMPALAGATYRIAVQQKLVTENTSLPDGCTVALLPPFSGG